MQRIPPHDGIADHRQQQPCTESAVSDGDLGRRRTGLEYGVRPRQLDGDLGAGIAEADDEGRTVCELRRISVVDRVQLHDPRIEILRERRLLRHAVGAGRDHDVLGLERFEAGLDDVALSVVPDPVDRDTRARRELEPSRVRLEVVGHLVLRRERPARRGEAHPRQSVVLRGREQTKGVPALAPRVSDPVVRVEDHERPAALPELVRGRQAGLAAADDHCLVPFHLAPPLLRLTGTDATSGSA